MTMPVQITFHGLPASNALSDYVQRKAEKLSRIHDRITHCKVAVESPHKHSRLGSDYRVRVELGPAVIVGGHYDAYAAVDAAFEDAQRTLRERHALVHGDVKSHARAPRGTVSKLFSYEGYGFLRTEDGRELYFHRNSVENHGFARMRVGSRVRFTESDTDDGGHASHVVVLRGHKRI